MIFMIKILNVSSSMLMGSSSTPEIGFIVRILVPMRSPQSVLSN